MKGSPRHVSASEPLVSLSGPHDQPCLRAMPTIVYENDSPTIRYSPEPQPISSTYAFPFPPGCA